MNVNDLAETLHLFFCRRNHCEDLSRAFDTEDCIFFLCESIDGGDAMADRKFWRNAAARLVYKYGGGDVSTILKEIKGFLRLKATNPDLLNELINLYLNK